MPDPNQPPPVQPPPVQPPPVQPPPGQPDIPAFIPPNVEPNAPQPDPTPLLATAAPDSETVATRINDYGRIAVSAITMLAFLTVTILLLTHAIKTSDQTTQGVLSTFSSLATIVVTYWMGSSAGSTAKNATLSAIHKSSTALLSVVRR